MFNYLFNYWLTITDLPSILIFLNFWFYNNIRYFKIKVLSSIVFYVSIFNRLKSKMIKIFYYDFFFNYLYINFIFTSFFLILVLIIFQ